MTDRGVIDDIESAVELASQELLMAVTDVLDAMGPRPAGWVKGNEWEELGQYLQLRDDPAKWTEQLQGWAAQMGPSAAVVVALREDTRLNRLLAGKGGWDGTNDDVERALRDGAAAVRNYEALVSREHAAKVLSAAQKVKTPLARAVIVGALGMPSDSPQMAQNGAASAPPSFGSDASA